MDQEDIDLSKSSTAMKLVSSMRKVLECPVCLEMVTAPALQCVRGHVTCGSCAKQLTSCSLCRQPLLQEQPTCLNSMLEVLPRQCRYSEEGCKVIFMPDDDSHEQFCGFRTMQCRHCITEETMIKVKDIRQHYREVHPDIYVVTTLSTTDFQLESKAFYLQSRANVYIPVMSFEHTFFYIKLDKVEGNLKITFEAFLEEKPKCNYYVKVKFAKKTLEYLYVDNQSNIRYMF